MLVQYLRVKTLLQRRHSTLLGLVGMSRIHDKSRKSSAAAVSKGSLSFFDADGDVVVVVVSAASDGSLTIFVAVVDVVSTAFKGSLSFFIVAADDVVVVVLPASSTASVPFAELPDPSFSSLTVSISVCGGFLFVADASFVFPLDRRVE